MPFRQSAAIPTASSSSSFANFWPSGESCSDLYLAEDGRKANLFATIGPTDKPGVMLSGHTDVVPVDGQNWSKDPFRMTLADEKAYGRGAADMKGFLACVLAAR